MKRITKNFLRIAFIIDGVIAVGFGLYSWFCPLETFGTIIAIPEMGSPAFLAILSSLSLFYILIGLTCLIGFTATFPINIWIGLLMIARHLLEGIMKIFDIGKEWLIGSPYPDIIIHSVFILVYILAIYFAYMNKQATDNSSG
jgi:hypothetical protein